MNKNILDSSGMPLPVARTDIKAEMKKLAFESYRQGLDSAFTILLAALSAPEPESTLTAAETIELVKECQRISHANIPTDNK